MRLGTRATWTTTLAGGPNSRAFFKATDSSLHYVVAASQRNPNAYENDIGTYTVQVSELTGADDLTADAMTPGSITVRQRGSSAEGWSYGRIETPGDVDWFKVTLKAGEAYRTEMTGSGSIRDDVLLDAYVRGMHDSGGTLIAGTTDDNSGVGTASEAYYLPSAAGTYYVAAGASGYLVGNYKIRVTEIQDDFTADTTTTGTVEVGGSVTGEIDYRDDSDWFKVTLEANKMYRFDLRGSCMGYGTLSDPYLGGIYDSAGTLIDGATDDNDGGCRRNSRVHFMPSAAGAYYVAAGVSGLVGRHLHFVGDGISGRLRGRYHHDRNGGGRRLDDGGDRL